MNNNAGIARFLSIERDRGASNEISQQHRTSYYGDYFTSKTASSLILSSNTFQSTNTSLCEESSASSSLSSPLQQQQQQRQIQSEYERLRREQEKPCSTCKYTGMTVCAGLSLYFIKLATEETAATTFTATKTAVTKTTKNHKPFFYIGAAAWAIAGVYRSILD